MKPVVVVLTSRYPYPLTKGDRLRAYHQIKKIAEYCTVDLISLCLTEPSDEQIEELKEIVRSITLYPLSHVSRMMNLCKGLFSRMPFQVRYFYDEKLADMIQLQISQIKPDVIYTQLIRMASYVKDYDSDTMMHLDYMDSMVLNDLGKSVFSGWRKPFIPLERSRIKRYESDIAPYFDELYTISARDKEHFQAHLRSRVKIIPNGVDTAYYKPKHSSHVADLGFSGNLSYAPNVAAAMILKEQILPQLYNRTCWIAGADLAESSPLRIESQNCVVSGYIDDMRELYHGVKIYVAPIYMGSGIQNKILEAMACGTICITTTFVNASIQAQPDQEIVIADSNEAFIEQINDLLSHPQKRQLLAEKARNFVELNYDWDVHNQKLVDSIISSRST